MRHPCRRRAGDPGFSLVELLVVMASIGVLATLVVPQLLMAYERTRQRRSLADMRSIASANGTYRVDNDAYAGDMDDLIPLFMNPVPPTDAWGTAWSYGVSGASYTLSSFGSDGAAGPAPPLAWTDEPFESDLVVIDGAFTQAPATR